MQKKKLMIFGAFTILSVIIMSLTGISPAAGIIISVMYVGCVRYAVGFNGITVNPGNGLMNVSYSRNEFKCYIDIEFDIEVQSRVILSVYDMYGGLVKNLIDDNMTAGKHTLSWKSTYHPESAGPFYYKLKAGNVTEVKKVVYS
jgi:hypothetical protein